MNLFKHLPDEIILTLFCYLDKESKQIAAEVCRHWRILIHDMSWKSITRLVDGDITMKVDFSNFGWEENKHELGQCRCIELHLKNPFNNVSWKNASYDDVLFSDVYDSSMVFEQSKVICAEPYIRKKKKGKWVSIVNLHELDLTETSPSWKEIKEIEFEPKGMNGYVVVATELKSCGKTLVLNETLDGAREKLEEVRITLWNLETWELVSQLPIQETIDEIMKLKLTGHGVSEPNFEIWKIDLLFEVSSDIIVIGANVDVETGMWSLSLFWKFDASNPAVPNFMTYILDEDARDNDPLKLHLNSKYFIERKRKKLQVFLIEDIKNNATSKSLNIPLKSGYEDLCVLEGGNSNRLAVLNGTRSELKVINIKSGECMLLLNFTTIHQLTSENMWKLCKNFSPQLKFHLGKLIFIQTLRKCNDRRKYRHKIVMIDDMGVKVNNFVLDSSIDYDYYESPSFHFENPKFFFGSSSIVMKHLNKTYHWLLTAIPKSKEDVDADTKDPKNPSKSAFNDLVDSNFGPGDTSSGQFGSAGQSADPCEGMTLKISTSTDLWGGIEGASREIPCAFGSSSASDDPQGSSSKA